jgi:hypothetical protein
MSKEDNFVRQPGNDGSVVNTDKNALEAYKKRKNREKEINSLKEEISEIKLLLQQLITKEYSK